MKNYLPVIFIFFFFFFSLGEASVNQVEKRQKTVVNKTKESERKINETKDIKQTKEEKNLSLYTNLLKNLEIETVEKKKIHLGKVNAPIIIINFWATWCQPCLAEFNSLVELKKKYSDDKILVVAFNIDDEIDQAKEIKKINKKYNLNFDIVADKNKVVFDKFEFESIPASVIFIHKKAYSFTQGPYDFNSDEILKIFDPYLK